MVFQRLFDIILCSEVGVGQEIRTLLHGGLGGGLLSMFKSESEKLNRHKVITN